MRTNGFILPDWFFIGGNSEIKGFDLTKPDGSLYNFQNGTCRLSIVDFINRSSAPSIIKTADITADKNGVYNHVVFELLPQDTVDLYGKYLYQLSVRDDSGGISIVGQGIVRIKRNIDPGFIGQSANQCIC